MKIWPASKLSRKKQAVIGVDRPAVAPPGERLYAIGDIHGRGDLLAALLEKIANDRSSAGGMLVRLIFLGDYIDRGDASRQVVERLIALAQTEPHATFLKGNHEDVMLEAFEDERAAEHWLHFGGRETLASYGVSLDADQDTNPAAAAARAMAELETRMPRSHKEFFNALQISAAYGDYFFVHAGIRPEIPLARQIERDMLWIRDDFFHSSARPDKVIVHGHTPVEAPLDEGWRIDIDTGAVYGGALTCLVLERDQRRFLQAEL